MNKVILMGRLTGDPAMRTTAGATPVDVATYTLAVSRRFKRDGSPDADFINCIAFGRDAEFANKYLTKGSQILVVGHIQNSSYTNKENQKVYRTDIVVDEHYFTGSKKDTGTASSSAANNEPDELPFN